jgi:iron(III) transport system ATP-binding protein
VTHDQTEAMALGHRIAIMNQGRLEQLGAPMEVYNRPANTFVARFVGSPPMNLFEVGEAAEKAETADAFSAAAHRRVLADRPDLDERLATVGIRPEHLRMVPRGAEPPAGSFTFEAVVKAALPTGSSWTVLVTAGHTELYLVAYTDVTAEPGETVRCAVRVADLHLFDAPGNRLPDDAADAAQNEENTATWAS